MECTFLGPSSSRSDREITNLVANSGPREPLANDRIKQILETLDRTRATTNWTAPGGGLSVRLRIQTVDAFASAFHEQDKVHPIPSWVQADASRGFPRTFCWDDVPLVLFTDEGTEIIRTLKMSANHAGAATATDRYERALAVRRWPVSMQIQMN